MELKKEIGGLALSPLTYVNIAAYDFSEAKVYKMKWLEIFGVSKEVAFMIACLIRLKDSCSVCPHLKREFFLIMDWRGKTIHENSRKNLLTKFI